ncbi:Wsc domain [Mycena indigotica]|uniref:Wsc domain n=1 Tax=Mycena indigotica TaxID=2126181 RepID=A0A8H6SGB7_9AGAR|nr:Wsc domain [Mycena indigotica]KAF7297325.1 Wsc domain [Mycena indigotica]
MSTRKFIWLASTLLWKPSEAYWLMAPNNILTTQRLDPVISPGSVSTHVHAVVGGSNFGLNTTTARLRESACTSIPIPEDKSNYWYPQLYFQWSNGSFTSVAGNPVICNLT